MTASSVASGRGRSDGLARCKHLVVVCCHAIWRGGPTRGEDHDEWLLEPFQAGESPTFLAHIKAGLDIWQADEDAIIIFSGGPTKPHATPLSEGQSYLVNLAVSLHGGTSPRLQAECRATDSFQNLLFSLLHFQASTQRPPDRLTVVSHAFKRSRFVDQHCPALGWPADRIEYAGIDPDKDAEGRQQIETGEAKARAQWARDPWGWGTELGGKRVQRGWADATAEQLPMPDLVRWRGGSSGAAAFPGHLPWAATP